MPKQATRLVLAWARLYTRGISLPIAEDRRREIASDLFEQSQLSDTGGSRGRHVLARALRGVLADLTWREHQLALEEKRRLAEASVADATVAIRLSLVLTVVGVVLTTSGAAATIRSFVNTNAMTTPGMPHLLLASTVLALASTVLSRRPSSQLIGSVLVGLSVVAVGAAVLYGMPSLGDEPSRILATATASLPRGLWSKVILMAPALIAASACLAVGARLARVRRSWN